VDRMDLRSVLLEIHSALREAGIDHALIGGLALAAHGAARATRRWERVHAPDLEAILEWIDELRALLGDPPVERRPWRGSDFRL